MNIFQHHISLIKCLNFSDRNMLKEIFKIFQADRHIHVLSSHIDDMTVEWLVLSVQLYVMSCHIWSVIISGQTIRQGPSIVKMIKAQLSIVKTRVTQSSIKESR